MRTQEPSQITTATSPATASTAVAGTFKGDMLTRADYLVIDGELRGATGGVLDVFLQRRVGSSWIDLAHFPTLTAGASTRRYSFTITGRGSSIVEVGADLAPALAAGAAVDVNPGGDVQQRQTTMFGC